MSLLADVFAVELVACQIFRFSASVGYKLLRANVLPRSLDSKRIDSMVSVNACAPADTTDKEHIQKWLRLAAHDCFDEILASGLLQEVDPTILLCGTASHNFLVASRLLLERGADLHHVEVRRCRRRSIVDMAAHAASLDEDWRLVLFLLLQGALPISPQGVLFAPLRQGKITTARELFEANGKCDDECLCSLLCDMCSHGQLPAITFLLDEVGVSVNGKNSRDGLTGTDRALAWHRWDAAEWLIMHRSGMPSKKSMALGNLLDASGDAVVERIIELLMRRNFFSALDVLSAAAQRGDLALCEKVLARIHCKFSQPVDVIDNALCHGHLRIALVLLKHGIQPKSPAKCRADAWLHGGTQHDVAEEILMMLPACAVESFPQAQLQGRSCASYVVDHMGIVGLPMSATDLTNRRHESDALALVPV